jgi:hypothetical protein
VHTQKNHPIELQGIIQYHLGIEVKVLPNQPSFLIPDAIGSEDMNYPVSVL